MKRVAIGTTALLVAAVWSVGRPGIRAQDLVGQEIAPSGRTLFGPGGRLDEMRRNLLGDNQQSAPNKPSTTQGGYRGAPGSNKPAPPRQPQVPPGPTGTPTLAQPQPKPAPNTTTETAPKAAPRQTTSAPPQRIPVAQAEPDYDPPAATPAPKTVRRRPSIPLPDEALSATNDPERGIGLPVRRDPVAKAEDASPPPTSSRRTAQREELETPRVARSLPKPIDEPPVASSSKPATRKPEPVTIDDSATTSRATAGSSRKPGPVGSDDTIRSARRTTLSDRPSDVSTGPLAKTESTPPPTIATPPAMLTAPTSGSNSLASTAPATSVGGTSTNLNSSSVGTSRTASKSPAISLETIGPRRITIGKEAPYTVKLRNSGDQAANDVVVYVAVPAWAEIVEARGSVGSTGLNGDKPELGLQWRIPQLAAASEQELSLKIIPRRSQPFDVSVRWTYTPPATQATVEVQEPKLQMVITGPTEVPFGEQRVYKLSISNPGTGDADDVTIHLLPITAQDGPTASHRLGTLKAGASTAVEIELTARQAGRLSIRAEATADAGITASAVSEVLVRRAALAATIMAPKVHYAGAPIPCELHVRNTGDAVAKNVTVALPLPPGADLHSVVQGGQPERRGNDLMWLLDELPAGGERTIVFKCTLRTPGDNRLETLAAADGDLRSVAVTNTRIMAVADLVLEVADQPGPLPISEDMVYTVKVRNRGSSAAQEVDVVAHFSNGVDPVSVEGGLHEIGSGTVVFRTLSSLAAGGEQVFRIRARATAAGNHRMRVELQCKPLGTRLTQELTTLFYSENPEPAQPAAVVPVAPLQETPAVPMAYPTTTPPLAPGSGLMPLPTP